MFQERSTPPGAAPRYDAVSRMFHWLTAIAVVAAFVLGPEGFGKLMRQGVDPATRLDIVWHETLGVAIFALTGLRLLWSVMRPAAPQFAMASWMRWASKAMHVALWALLIATPLAALLALGSEAHPLTLLGGVRVEQMPWIADSALAALADWGDVHGLLGDAIVWLAGLHALAGLLHHFMLKDGVLLSMMPPRSRQ